MVLWMRVSADEYELPECVTPSLPQLAHKYGVSISTIQTSAYRKKKHGYWRRVEVEYDEEC